MSNELKIKLDPMSLATLLRSNLSCFMGKTITQELLNELTLQIIDSISFFINQKS